MWGSWAAIPATCILISDTSFSSEPNRFNTSSISPPPEPVPTPTGVLAGRPARKSYCATLLTLVLRRRSGAIVPHHIFPKSRRFDNQENENAVLTGRTYLTLPDTARARVCGRVSQTETPRA